MKDTLKMQINHDNNNWFETWFDSKYYHILYNNRDVDEAEFFINNLIKILNPDKESKMIDIACGKGRHANYINQLGFTIDAFDLSKNSINEAKKLENDTLSFFVNDIRKPLKKNYYDTAFNLFTSFGYFTNECDNEKAVIAMADGLKKDGTLVIDFLNVELTLKKLIPFEKKKVGNITFNLTKKIENNFIIKNIEITDEGKKFNFTEKVKLIRLDDFKNYLNLAGLCVVNLFGDYSLNPFHKNNSERLIIFAKK